MQTRGTDKRLGGAGARRYWLIWFAVAPVALWALVRILGLDRGFPLVLLMAFTPYAAVAALLIAGVATAARNWAAAVVAALVTACLIAAVLPRAVGDNTASADGRPTLSVLSTNIYLGRADPATIVGLVDRYDVDLLSVQELTPTFAVELRRAGLNRRLPHLIAETRPEAAGAGLYSRLPMRKLVGEPFFFRMPRAVLRLPGGRLLRIVGVHPYPPVRGSVDVWKEALTSLPAAGDGSPWLLVGDFNATLDE